MKRFNDTLGIDIDYVRRRIRRNGFIDVVDFDRKVRPWDLFIAVSQAEAGLTRSELLETVWRGKPVFPWTVDKARQRLNALLEPIELEIRSDSEGRWHLADIRQLRSGWDNTANRASIAWQQLPESEKGTGGSGIENCAYRERLNRFVNTGFPYPCPLVGSRFQNPLRHELGTNGVRPGLRFSRLLKTVDRV